MLAVHATTSVISLVLPMGADPPADGALARSRGRSAVAMVAETSAGILKQAGPPGAYGAKTLWAMCWGLWGLWLLRVVLAAVT